MFSCARSSLRSKPGLEQKRETARLIIIALPEGSIRRTDGSDAQRVSESQLNLTQTLNKALAARVVSNGTNEWLKLLVKGESVTHPPQSWANFGYLISGWGISANTFIVLIYLEYKTPKVILPWCSSAQTLLLQRFSPQKQMDQSLYGARFTSGVFLRLVCHGADMRKWCLFFLGRKNIHTWEVLRNDLIPRRSRDKRKYPWSQACFSTLCELHKRCDKCSEESAQSGLEITPHILKLILF